jgi:hypothetical protein
MLNASGFDFGSGGGSRKKEYILIGSLVAVIVVVLVIMLIMVFKPNIDDLPKDFHMYCLKCNKEVIVSREDIVNTPKEPAAGPPVMPSLGFMPQRRATCPICKTPSLIQERHCPKCSKWFVTDWDKTHNPWETTPTMPQPTIICPYCKTPINSGLQGPGMPMPGGPGGPGRPVGLPGGGPGPMPAPTGG